MRSFYHLLVNSLISSFTNMTVWFAVIFYVYLQTEAVLATSLLGGIYLATVAVTGFWFGNLVDKYKKKHAMLLSNIVSLIAYALCFAIYTFAPQDAFTHLNSVVLWIFAPLLLMGVIAGNIRNIALPTLVTILVPEKNHDKANGLVGTATGIAFLATSVVSGFLVGHSGMYLVLVLAMLTMGLTILHLLTISIPEKKVAHTEDKPVTLDIPGTLKVIFGVPGLMALILFTTFNNFLGGVFMALMDAYGLQLVSVQVWGILWGVLSCAFIVGGLVIAKWGLGKNPLNSLFMANITIWSISTVFTLYPSIILLAFGMFIYLCVVPYIEASEHTIVQKVVPLERQGRVFGFAQSVEQAASPLSAFAVGPIAQFFFIPFMTTGDGARYIGSWFGTGPDRGIALVFTLAGVIGLSATLIARFSQHYKLLSVQYLKKK